MWLVKRNTLQKIRAISSPLKTVLIHTLIEGREITLSCQHILLALLQEAHENGYWIACDCKTNAVEPPLLYVRRSEMGRLALVRMPNRTAHAEACAFKWFEQEATSATASSSIKSWDKASPLNLHRGLNSSLAIENQEEGKNESISSSTRVPRMGRFLYTLLTDAGLTKIQAQIPDLSTQFNAIKQIAPTYFLAKKILLSQYLWTFPSQIGFAAVKLKKDAAHWPTSARPYGIFTVIVEHFENNVAHCPYRGETIEIALKGNLTFSSGRLGKDSGPYLLLFTLTDFTERPGSFDPMNGFAVPIYSQNLCAPVESNYERRVLQKLIQLKHAFNKKNVSLVIEKPLVDIKVKRDNPLIICRPDFLLKTNNRCVVLEVMGSQEEHYVERKTRTHQIMQQLGTLVLFDALKTDQTNQWDAKLNELCKEIYRLLL